jgi:uncharacterized protein
MNFRGARSFFFPQAGSLFAVVVTIATTATTSANADQAGPTAVALAQRFLEHDPFGFRGAKVVARLRLTEADGTLLERKFEAMSKEGTGHRLSTVVRFTAPANVAGTAFLIVEHKDGPDEEYVYLPRLKSTRRVSGTGERDASFMGSDFTYGDLERQDVREATFARLTDDNVGHDACYVLQATPRPGARYGRIVSWIRQVDYVPLRVEMFSSQGALSKTTFTRRVRVVDGTPIVAESHTENATTHHQTDLIIDDVEFRSDLPDSSFTPAALEH